MYLNRCGIKIDGYVGNTIFLTEDFETRIKQRQIGKTVGRTSGGTGRCTELLVWKELTYRFESCLVHNYGYSKCVARMTSKLTDVRVTTYSQKLLQLSWLEQQTHNLQVGGSRPSRGTKLNLNKMIAPILMLVFAWSGIKSATRIQNNMAYSLIMFGSLVGFIVSSLATTCVLISSFQYVHPARFSGFFLAGFF